MCSQTDIEILSDIHEDHRMPFASSFLWHSFAYAYSFAYFLLMLSKATAVGM
jgi:hypothetical protein